MIGAVVAGLERTLAKMARLKSGADQATRQTVAKGSLVVRGKLVDRLTGRKGWDPFWGVTSPEGAYLGGRTGQTRQRISPGGLRATYKVGNAWQAAVGSPDPHVKLHEEGGTVPGGPIPTAAAMRRSGTLRFRPSAVPGGFVWPNAKQLAGGKMRAKRRWIATAARGRLVLMFMLNPNPVRHRPRRFMRKAADESRAEVVALGRLRIGLETARAG